MVKVIWTEFAIEDLNSIGDYIAKDSIKYSELTVTELLIQPIFLNAIHLLVKLLKN